MRAPRGESLDVFVAAVRWVSRLAGYFAAGLIALGVVVVCQMVFVRYALGQSTIWQTDFVTYSLIAATHAATPEPARAEPRRIGGPASGHVAAAGR